MTTRIRRRSKHGLRVLDPVTYVRFRITIKQGIVARVNVNTFMTKFSGPLHADREHIDWIRGHYGRRSPEGAALLAANALAK